MRQTIKLTLDPAKPPAQRLIIKLHGRRVSVSRPDYVAAKTKDLIAFGYTGLTEKEVDDQVTAVLQGKKLLKGLTVIGGFMKDEICEIVK